MPTLIDLRIGPVCALTKWRPDYVALTMVEHLATKGLAPRFERELEWEILLTNSVTFGDARLALLQSSYNAAVASFVQFMADNEAEIDAVLSIAGSKLSARQFKRSSMLPLRKNRLCIP